MDAYTTLHDNDLSHGGSAVPQRNLSNYIPPSTAEGALLFIVALTGGLGNIFIMVVTLFCPTFRQMSSAFLFHHCLLDTIKSGFCIPFGYSLLLDTNIPHCDLLGAGYILLMTVSAYNLLALLVNEEYQCSFTSRRNYHKNGDGCCIAFGVVITWFTTVLLHLGVAFLPGNSEYSKDVGNCIYRYGVTKNYVIHALWVILVTAAIVVAGISFFHFFRKLRTSAKSRKWTFLHKSLSSLSPHNALYNDQTEEVHYEFDDLSSQMALKQSRRYLRRIIIMMGMVVSFVVCWYPLFVLTLLDVHYKQPPHFYRLLMILAWAHPITTPIFCGIIYYDTAKGEQVTKDVYTNALPMTTSRSGDAIRQEINHLYEAGGGGIGFHNENFQFMSNHAEESPQHHHVESESESTRCDTLTSHCETIINYNTDEGACQTLIM